MQLIYVWIEKFRNIEKCGFKLFNNFFIDVEEFDKIECRDKMLPVVKIKITKKMKR